MGHLLQAELFKQNMPIYLLKTSMKETQHKEQFFQCKIKWGLSQYRPSFDKHYEFKTR